VKRLTENGVRELTLIGQNVNAYHGEGPDGQSWPLGKLLHRLAAISGIARLRYSTSHPGDVDDSLIEAHRDLPVLMPFVHLPVQSGSDRILAAMNRKQSVFGARAKTLHFHRILSSASPAKAPKIFPPHSRLSRKSDTLPLIRSNIRRGRGRLRRTCGRRFQRLTWTSDWRGSRN
jgi:hypothetical protein